MKEAKKCKGKCGEIKPLSEYHKDKQQKDGHRARCKFCLKTKSAQNKTLRKQKKEEEQKKIIKIPANKIRCNRNGNIMLKSKCIPGCNDACLSCENKQLDNIQAGSDIITAEQEKIQRHGLKGIGYSSMIETHAEI